MKIDFHYYSIYTLCRLIGLNHQRSWITAYASQQVDDAKHHHTLYFEEGGRMNQIQSSHKFLTPSAADKDVMYDVYMPFHYLPCLDGKNFEEKMICKPNSVAVKSLFENTVMTLNRPYGFHRLGVSLHVIADTYSHENYAGIKSHFNFLSDVKLEKEDYEPLRSFQLLGAKLAPEIGHAYVYDVNDESNLVWSYKNYAGQTIKINNLKVYRKACYEIYEMLKAVKEVWPEYFGKEIRTLDEVYPCIQELYKIYDTIELREKAWLSAWEKGLFGFVASHPYNHKTWFKEAVVVESYNWIERYIKKENFKASNWKLFQDALKIHLSYVHIDLLPKYSIYM